MKGIGRGGGRGRPGTDALRQKGSRVKGIVEVGEGGQPDSEAVKRSLSNSLQKPFAFLDLA